MQVLRSIVIHVLITLMIILFRTVLFALASPGPPDLLDEAKEAIHACPPRAVPLTQAQTAALSQRVCVKVCVLFHKEHSSERSQKERKSETEAERERRRGRELQGGKQRIAVSWRRWVKYQSTPVRCSPLKNTVRGRVLSHTTEWVFVHACTHV